MAKEIFNCAYTNIIEIHKIVLNPKNTNKHPEKQIDFLSKAIDFNGQRSPIVISKRSGFVVKGEGRYLAMKKLGWDKVAVDYQSYENEAAEFADLEADNRLAAMSMIDEEKSQEYRAEIFADDFDLEILGLEQNEIEDNENENENENTENENDDVVPEIKENIYGVRIGDIWGLGDHRIMCGDCTVKENVDKLMDGEKADMVFTDPPYNQEVKGGFKGKIGSALQKQAEEIEHLCNFNPQDFLKTLNLYMQKGKANFSIFCNKDLILDYLLWGRENDFSSNVLVWKKESGIPIGGSYIPDIEYLLVFRKSAIFNRIEGATYSKVLVYSREKNKIHPTMKPVQLLVNQILICTNKKVVDPFLGSGSTLIACEKTNRKCYGMEIDPHYCSVVIKRWEDYTGKKAVKL